MNSVVSAVFLFFIRLYINANATIDTIPSIPSPADKPTIADLFEESSLEGAVVAYVADGELVTDFGGLGEPTNCSAVKLSQVTLSGLLKSNR